MPRKKPAADPHPATCVACKFFKAEGSDEGEPVGLCRRYPPLVLTDEAGQPFATQPLVSGSDWCGDFTGGQ